MSLSERSIWLDVTGAQNREHFDRGIPRYVRDHAMALVAHAPTAIAGVGLNGGLPLTANLDGLVGTGLLRWSAERPADLPDVFHVMSPFELQLPLEQVWPEWARGSDVRTAVTLYDLIPLVFREHYLRDPAMRARYQARAELVRRADHVFAISQTTAEDGIRLLGLREDRVTVIDAGVSGHFGEAFGSADEARHVLDRRFGQIRPGFMLYVAGVEYRKNIDRLIAGHARTSTAFRDRHQLVITCRMRDVDEQHLRQVARDAGLREGDLVLTNYVSDAELAALYWTCALFVFASFYEGSGLPILEAMACGAPVAASSTSTSPEILGDREGTFDPFDPVDIGRVLEEALGDDDLLERLRDRSRRRVREYTWERTAAATLTGYERMTRPSGRRARPLRIALHTPWPPERSGIAEYNRRLVSELIGRVEVDIVVDGPVSGYVDPPGPGARLVPVADLERMEALRSYDRHVYCMGNSHFHHHVYDALQQRPGVVVCHDVRFGGFYGSYVEAERPGDPAGRLAERLAQQYGGRLGHDYRHVGPSPWEQSDLGIYLSADVQAAAEMLVVHSQYSADLLRLDTGPGGASPPVRVVPLAHPAVRPVRDRVVPDGGGLIVSLGIVSAVKMPDVLIDALAQVRRTRPDARLIFAGGAPPAELAELREHADEAGVQDAVEVLGHVDDETWERLLDEAHVAVQLRRIQNGEASAAVADALAAGLPTVVTAQGWASELSDDLVEKVPLELTAPVLAQAILRVLDDPARADELSRAARDHAERTSFARVAEHYLEILGAD